MESAALQLSLFVIQEAIKNEPAVAEAIRELLNKADPTDADWDGLRAKVAKTYRDYVPATAIPPETP